MTPAEMRLVIRLSVFSEAAERQAAMAQQAIIDAARAGALTEIRNQQNAGRLPPVMALEVTT